MSVRTVFIGLMVLAGFAVAPRTWAGIYNSTDNPKAEVRWSQDYERVFREVLSDLKTIALAKPPRQPAIWKRYALMEALGRKGANELKTLEQQLDYSAVLIRRDKAAEAVQLLLPLARENRNNFVLQSQLATAMFLSKSDDFRVKAPEEMQQALAIWPEKWGDLDDDAKRFVESLGWEETAFDRNRRFAVHYERLLRHRVRESAARKKDPKLPEMLDPIFIADKKPVRFLSEGDKFEPGRIALAEKEKLPDDAVEIVEQFLIWMPHDQRLLWLLGEVFNARAMKFEKKADKDNMIRNAYVIFAEMNDPLNLPNYGRKEIKERYDVLNEYSKTIEDPRGLKNLKIEDLPPDTDVTNQQLQRGLVVGFITGFAVGILALWQIQEMRRRRLARATASRAP